MPYAANLEKLALPQVNDIVNMVRNKAVKKSLAGRFDDAMHSVPSSPKPLMALQDGLCNSHLCELFFLKKLSKIGCPPCAKLFM